MAVTYACKRGYLSQSVGSASRLPDRQHFRYIRQSHPGFPKPREDRQKLSSTAVPPSGDSDHGWSEIEHSIAEIAEFSQSDISFAEFAKELLDRTAALLSAAGGAVWLQGQQAELHPQYQVNMELLGFEAAGGERIAAAHTRFLHSLMQTGEGRVVSPRSTPPSSETSENPSDHAWIGSAIRLDGNVVGVIEVIHRLKINAATERGNLRLLAMVCDLSENFLRRQQLHQLRQSEQRWQQYEGLVSRVHANLDLTALAYQIVNDGRSFIGCDRISLIAPRGDTLQLIAISGVDTFDRRSTLLRSLETLSEVVVQSGQALRYQGETDHLAPQIEKPLTAYVDLSHARTIDVIPLRPRSVSPSSGEDQLAGVLVIEQFETSSDGESDVRASRLVNLAGLALRNALDYDTLPFLSLARFARRASRFGYLQRPKLLFSAVALVLLGLALAFLPASFYVKAEGELQPGLRRDIYAPHDGEVVKVVRQHDEDVEAGDVLLVLRSRPLEIEMQRLRGEHQTIEKKLLAVGAARVQTDRNAASANRYPGQLAAEEQELEQQLSSLEKQILLVRQQRDQLSVCSPIDGRVLTWNPRELLEDRPVQRGQLLMSTADIGGPWTLELLIPDHRIGYLMKAQSAGGEPLEVTFSLATDPGTTYRGRISQIAGRTESVDGKPASVRVTATVPDTATELLRPGATIHAKVDCGTRSLGFVWLHDIVEATQSWLFF